MILTVALVALVAVAFLGGDNDEPAERATTELPSLATTTTAPAGFPPAAAGSICHLLPDEMVEELVGEPPRHPVIEPVPQQCAWPAEEGTPLDAQLFFVVTEQQDADLRTVLEAVWSDDEFWLEPVDGVGDQAFLVIRRADLDGQVPEFVGSLDVYTDRLHVILGNGGVRPVWEGPEVEVRSRLVETMRFVLDRLADQLDDT